MAARMDGSAAQSPLASFLLERATCLPSPRLPGMQTANSASFQPYGLLPHSFIVPLFLFTRFFSFWCQLNDFGSEYLAVHTHGSLIAGSMTLVKAVWESLHFKTHSSFPMPQNLQCLSPADKRLLSSVRP